MWIFYVALFLSCAEPIECLHEEDFLNKWWQIEISNSLIGNCYLFSEDGHVVESDGKENWPIGKYALEQYGECQYFLITEDKTIEIFGTQEECLKLEYDGKNYSACECLF